MQTNETHVNIVSLFVPEMRRTLRLRDYWMYGVTSGSQEYGRGDCLPRTYNYRIPVSASSGAACATSGNGCNIAYTTETMFDLRAASGVEKAHFVHYKGISNWTVPLIASGEGVTAVTAFDGLVKDGKTESLFWEKLFADFPSLRLAFPDSKKTEYLTYFRSTMEVAEDEQAVAAIAQPFIVAEYEKNFISPSMQWRIAEKLANAIELHVSKHNRYERRAVREVIERVTKIGLNGLSKQPWMHEDTVNPILNEVGAFRPWHEAGMW